MPRLDQMHEQELVTELLRLAAECERLDFEVAQASQRQQYFDDPRSVLRAAQKERDLLVEMNRRRTVGSSDAGQWTAPSPEAGVTVPAFMGWAQLRRKLLRLPVWRL